MTNPTKFEFTAQDGEEPNSWIHPVGRPEEVLVRFFHPMLYENLAEYYCETMNNPIADQFNLWSESVSSFDEFETLSKVPEKMLWIITEDHQVPEVEGEAPWSMSDRGIGNFPPDHISKIGRWEALARMTNRQVTKTLPWEFKLFDDDMELYYSGRANSFDFPAEEAFWPWTRSRAGCTIMMIRDPETRKWSTL